MTNTIPFFIVVSSFSFISMYAQLNPMKNDCPVLCSGCNLGTLSCDKPGLTMLPQVPQNDISKIKLTHQHFGNAFLEQKNFTHYAPPAFEIRELIINNCTIEGLRSYAFAPLSVLKILDLSFNRLRHIENSAFHGLHLRTLILDGNVGLTLRSGVFNDLAVESLSLRRCALLTRDVIGWPNSIWGLKSLYLSNNRLDQLGYDEFVVLFHNITTLDLSDNPLKCSCQLFWLTELFMSIPSNSQGFIKRATCRNELSNGVLEDKTIISLKKSELKCGPPRVSGIQLDFLTWHSAQLTCNAIATTRVRLSWHGSSLLDGAVGKVLPHQQQKQDSAAINYSTTINIQRKSSVTNESVSGTYFCFVEDYFGNSTSLIRVHWPRDEQNFSSISGFNDKGGQQNWGSYFQYSTNATAHSSSNAERPFTMLHLLVAIMSTFVATLLIVLCGFKVIIYQHVSKKAKKAMATRTQDSKHLLCHRNYGVPYETSNSAEYQIYDVPQVVATPSTSANPPLTHNGTLSSPPKVPQTPLPAIPTNLHFNRQAASLPRPSRTAYLTTRNNPENAAAMMLMAREAAAANTTDYHASTHHPSHFLDYKTQDKVDFATLGAAKRNNCD